MLNGYRYSTLNRHSKRIRRVTIFALIWLFFSDIGDRYVLKDVVPSHTKLDRETLHGQMSTCSTRLEFIIIMYNYTRTRLTALMRASFAAPRILEPRKLILTATSNISRKFAPTKITRYTVLAKVAWKVRLPCFFKPPSWYQLYKYTCMYSIPGGRAREIAQLRATFRRDSASISLPFHARFCHSAQISRFCANVQTKNGEIVRQRQLAPRRCESRFLCAKWRYSARSPACARAGTVFKRYFTWPDF